MATVPKHDGKKERKCDDGKQSCLSEESKKKKTIKFICKIEWKVTYIDILKVLYIFPGWLCYFKGLLIPVWHEIHQSKFYMWHHDNWPIAQWMIFHAASATAYVNHSPPPCAFIIWFKSIQVKQVNLKTLSLAPSLHDLVHWSSLRSLLRT